MPKLRHLLPLLSALFVCLLATAPGQSHDLGDDELIMQHANEAWTGDLDGMVERGFVRILTAHNPLFFSYTKFEQRGLVVEGARALEKHLKKTLKGKRRSIHVVVIPVPRDQLLPGLIEGRGDIAAANLTITAERQKLVAFTIPTYPGVSELVITGPGAPEITSFDDLAATEVHLRKSSSYFTHLSALNTRRESAGKSAVPVRLADENLEDYDLLDMVNVGVIPAIVVDSHKAALWEQIFDDVVVHKDLAIHTGGSIAWAVRKTNPKLLAAANRFAKTARKGTLLGNILIKRYLGSTKWMDKVLSERHRQRYRETAKLIKRYAAKYDFDWLMIAAQGFQESRLDQSKRSHAGAIGIMQVLLSTAADPKVGIPDIHEAEQNVHAGVKYLRFLRDHYFTKPEIDPLDRVLFSFAAYNAGPGNIARARRRAKTMKFDPNVWFHNVEVAAARTISREPVIYVRNIYKYFVTYKQLERARKLRDAAKSKLE